TEYLGVSSAAFAPPLRRYLRSPQHGRDALRSSKSSSARFGSRPSRMHVRGKAGYALTGVGRAQRPISTTQKRREAGTTRVYGSDIFQTSPSESTAPRDLEQGSGSELDAAHASGSGSGVDVHQRMNTQPASVHSRTLLTPVGPDWLDSASQPAGGGASQASHGTAEARTDDSCDLDDAIVGFQTLMRKGRAPSGARGNHTGSGSDRTGDRSVGSSRSSKKQAGRGSHGELRHGVPLSLRDEECVSPMPRRRRRSRANGRHMPLTCGWDLHTGRRIERGRRKGSRDLDLPGEPSRLTEDQWMSRANPRGHEVLKTPAQGKSQTAPLEYPTPAVRRGITRFHEQVQRARSMEGKRPLENLPHVEELMKGVRANTTVQRTMAEAMPPPIRWEEEKNMAPGDILVTVEHCTACARHRMSLNHNADAYLQRAAVVQDVVKRALAAAGRPFSTSGQVGGITASGRLLQSTMVVTKPTTERSASGVVGRVGAFEVQVTACLLADQAQKDGSNAPLRQRAHHPTAHSSTVGLVRSLTASSKLRSGKWPNPGSVARKVVQVLSHWGALRHPPEVPSSDFQSLSLGAPKTRGPGERCEGVKDSTAAAARALPAQSRCLNDNASTELSGSEPDCASATTPSKSARLDSVDEKLASASKTTEASSGGGQTTGVEKGHGELIGEEVVGREPASPSPSSVNQAPSYVGESTKADGELVSESQGIDAVTPATPPSLYSLSVEDAFAEEVEFAAEGSTADPCFMLKIGSRKSKKSDPVADVQGGSGGQCRWPSQVCSVVGLSEDDLRSSSLEVEIWDDLGWKIAEGKISPNEVGPTLDAGLLSLNRAATSAPDGSATLPTPLTLTCALKSERSPANGKDGRVTLRIRLLSADGIRPGSRRSENGKSLVLRDSQESHDMSLAVKSAGKPASVRDGETDPQDLETCRERTSVARRAMTDASPSGNSPPEVKAGRITDDIDDLLGFSPRSSRNGSLMSSVSSGSSSNGRGGGERGSSDSDGLSDALGGVLGPTRATAEDDPMEESWSSVGSTVMESGQVVAVVPKLSAVPHAKDAHGASAPPGSEGEMQGLSPSTGLEESRASGRGPAGAPAGVLRESPDVSASARGKANEVKGAGPDERAFSPAATEVLPVAEGASAVAPEPRSSRRIFSFSSASSISSCSNTYGLDTCPYETGPDGEVEETRRVQQHAQSEMVIAAAAATLRRRLRRAAAQWCGGSSEADIREGIKCLFNRLDEDRDGQLTAEDLKNAFPENDRNMGLGSERGVIFSPATVMAALVAGMDRVGKRSANAPEFESFILDCPGDAWRKSASVAGRERSTSVTPPTPNGVEMAALWLRLRRAALTRGKQHQPQSAGAGPSHRVSIAGLGAREACGNVGEGGSGGAAGARGESELDGEVDLSRLGRGIFESRDPECLGMISQAGFREVMSSSEVQIEASLDERELTALSKHFLDNLSATEKRSFRTVRTESGARPSPEPGNMISYRALMDWVDPVDVGRIAKRVSRFLRAVGDPSSKLGALVASSARAGQEGRGQDKATRSLVEATASKADEMGELAAGEVSSVGPADDRSCAAEVPAATKANNIGPQDASGCANDAAGSPVADNMDGTGRDRGRIEAQGTDRGAMTELFRAVDIDGSGLISPQELQEAVNGLGLPVSAAEARLLVAEYGGTVRRGEGEGDIGGETQLSLGDFDSMLRQQT
ncbi:unnamed protein product, partial [Scytosiphon promiscuus]